MSIVDHGARTHPPPCALCSPVGRPTRFQLLIWFLAPPARTCRQRALLSRGGKNPDATGGGRLRHILDGGRAAGAVRALRPHHPGRQGASPPARAPPHLFVSRPCGLETNRRTACNTGGQRALSLEAGCHQAPPDASFRVRRWRIKPPFPKREEATIVGIVGLSGTGRVRPLGL